MSRVRASLHQLIRSPLRSLAVAERRYYQSWEMLAFCLLAIAVALVLGLVMLQRQDYAVAAVVYGFAVSQGLALRLGLRRRSRRLGRWLCVLSITLLLGFMLIDGGHLGTGPIVAVIFAPVIILLLGFRSGGLYFLALLGLWLLVSALEVVSFDHRITDPALYWERVTLAIGFVGLYFWLLGYSRAKVIERLQKQQCLMQQQAATDSLTGLANRRAMSRQLDQQECRSSGHDEVYSLVVGDIDLFKHINDRYGHHCGDQVIVRVAALLQSVLRRDDRLARWGGEEFLLLLPRTELPGALDVAEKLRCLVASQPIASDAGPLPVTMSFGVAVGRQGDAIGDVIKLADQALYLAKDQGRNHVCFIPVGTHVAEHQQLAANYATVSSL